MILPWPKMSPYSLQCLSFICNLTGKPKSIYICYFLLRIFFCLLLYSFPWRWIVTSIPPNSALMWLLLISGSKCCTCTARFRPVDGGRLKALSAFLMVPEIFYSLLVSRARIRVVVAYLLFWLLLWSWTGIITIIKRYGSCMQRYIHFGC